METMTLNRRVVSLYDGFVSAEIPSTQHPRNTRTFSSILLDVLTDDWIRAGQPFSTEELQAKIREYGYRPPSVRTIENFMRDDGGEKTMTRKNGLWYWTDSDAFRALPKPKPKTKKVYYKRARAPKGWRRLQFGEKITKESRWWVYFSSPWNPSPHWSDTNHSVDIGKRYGTGKTAYTIFIVPKSWTSPRDN